MNDVVQIISLYSQKLEVIEQSWGCSARALNGIYKSIVNIQVHLYGIEFIFTLYLKIFVLSLTYKWRKEISFIS